MNKKIIIAIIIIIGLIAAFFIFKPDSENEVKSDQNLVAREKRLVIGTVGEIPADEIEEYQPFIDYIASKLASSGIEKGEVVVASSPAEMSKFMRQGKVDMYIDSPFPVYVVSKLAEAEVLVDRWKKGEEKYHSVVFTRKDSNIDSLDELKGKVIAFESPYSTSGYFLPKSELIKRGYTLTEKTGPNDDVKSTEIGYYFTNDQEKVTEDVLKGVAVAGAQNQRDVTDAAGDSMSDLSIIFKSIDVYRHVIVARKGMPNDLKKSVKDIMVSLHESEEGRKMLADFKKTAKLGAHKDPDEVFEGVKELSALVESEIIRQ